MIRSVRLEDAEAIAAIYNEYVLHSVITFDMESVSVGEMARKISSVSARYPFWVCEEADGVVVGFCYAHPWKEKAAYQHTWETTIYLSPSARGKGLGRMLMEKLIADCRERGCRALIACITAGNEVSNRLHEKLGFEQVSHFKQVGAKFGRMLDVIDYELQL